MKNCWGLVIHTPVECAKRPRLRPILNTSMSKVFTSLGLAAAGAGELLDAVAAWKGEIIELENMLGEKIRKTVPQHQLASAIERRSEIIFGEIEGLLTGGSLLDVGCGNGLVSEAAAANFNRVLLVDVVRYLSHSVTLPFKCYTEGQKLPVSESYDTVLLLTVLHHTADPVFLLKEAWKRTSKRLLIIESVVGFEKRDGASNGLSKLPEADQVGYAVFIDWFYNRVLHDAIPVPFNFTSPTHWRRVFEQHRMPMSLIKDLGVDIPIAPEHHYLFVLERK